MIGIRSFPFEMAYFQGRTVSFREGTSHVSLPHAIHMFGSRAAGCDVRPAVEGFEPVEKS